MNWWFSRLRKFAPPSQIHSMSAIVRFGVDSSVALELAEGVLLAECGTPHAQPLKNPAEAVVHALVDPLEYPPLARSVTPSDRVVLVLGHDVPQAAEIVAAAVRCLVESGLALDGISVLQSRSDAEAGNADVCSGLPPDWRRQITVTIHDPGRRDSMAYLSASESGEPIVLNRAIIDADVVLPVGCMNRRKEAGRFGIHDTVFPTFSDQKTLERFRSPQALDPRGAGKRKLVEEVEQVGWLLGVTLTLQVVPGPGDRILHVLAGEVSAVARRSHELYRKAWSCASPGEASLVVASIEGGPVQQTWQNLGKALAAAAGLVEEGGAIAVCSNLAAKPGPGIQRLAGSPSPGATLKQIQKERVEDVFEATQLVEALTRARVYLLSGLEASLLEELDVAPLASTAELLRLVSRCPSCILLSNAHLAMVGWENGE